MFFIQFLCACAYIPNKQDIKSEAVQVLVKSLRPKLEKAFFEATPIFPAERSSYQLITKLPGVPYDLKNVTRGELSFDANGNFLMPAGDYAIPVITYCMKQSGASPSGHIYSLSKLEGTRALMIRELNLRGPSRYRTEDIQIVSWSLQTGLSYDEMTKFSQKIIDDVIPQFKNQLKDSFLSTLEKKWNQISSVSHGVLPTFDDSSEDLLFELGDVGKKIIEFRKFKELLRDVGHDYSRLSEIINTTSLLNKKEITETQWSQISKNVYARFVTEGHFGDIGFIQIRILANEKTIEKKREVNAVLSYEEVVDLFSLLANPNSDSVQPLTFTPLYGSAGVLILPALMDNPVAATMVLAAILTAKIIDWDSFFNLYDLSNGTNYPQLKKEFEKGFHALSEAHDKLEKPLKDAGVINGKTKNTSDNKTGDVREYTKDSGEEQLQKDFDKIPGKISKAEDGTEYKIQPDGSKVVKRPPKDGKPPCLEVQSPKSDANPRLKVKVRY